MRLEKFVIDGTKPTHLAWWAAHFEVSEEALLAAIAAVGDRADAVRTYLNEQQQQTRLSPGLLSMRWHSFEDEYWKGSMGARSSEIDKKEP